MNQIPQHCIDRFKGKFGQQPSVIEIEYNNIEVFDKFTSKSYTIWHRSVFRDKGVEFLEKYIEYDATGIYFYTEKIGENKLKLFILTTTDRQNVAEFIINNLIKANKDGNN
jgi:hypothetical protein